MCGLVVVVVVNKVSSTPVVFRCDVWFSGGCCEEGVIITCLLHVFTCVMCGLVVVVIVNKVSSSPVFSATDTTHHNCRLLCHDSSREPIGRSWMSVCSISDRKIFMFGGFSQTEEVLGKKCLLVDYKGSS